MNTKTPNKPGAAFKGTEQVDVQKLTVQWMAEPKIGVASIHVCLEGVELHEHVCTRIEVRGVKGEGGADA